MAMRTSSLRRTKFTPLRLELLEPRLTLSSHPLAALMHGESVALAMGGMDVRDAAEVAHNESHSQVAVMTTQGNGEHGHGKQLASGQSVRGSDGDMSMANMKEDDDGEDNDEQENAQQLTFAQTNLVSNDTTVIAANQQDANLVNAIGIAPAGHGMFWIAENGTGKAELISAGGQVMQTITIPATLGSVGTPTGIVVLGKDSTFLLKNGQPASVVLATEDGTIVAWGPSLGTTAEVEVDNSANPTAGAGAVYKGLAVGQSGGSTFLYATNFRTGAIDVFDTSFQPVSSLPGNFTDPATTPLPPLPAGAVGYVPFGIQALNGKLYVTFAAQDSALNVVSGAGAGFVDVFNTDGTFVGRVATGGALNAPYGLALAPAHFGQFGGALLVANFGDGTINAFSADAANPASLGPLTDSAGNPITIDGLSGLAFSSSHSGHDDQVATLFFTAGPNGKTAGLFGKLTGSAVAGVENEMETETDDS